MGLMTERQQSALQRQVFLATVRQQIVREALRVMYNDEITLRLTITRAQAHQLFPKSKRIKDLFPLKVGQKIINEETGDVKEGEIDVSNLPVPWNISAVDPLMKRAIEAVPQVKQMHRSLQEVSHGSGEEVQPEQPQEGEGRISGRLEHDAQGDQQDVQVGSGGSEAP